MEKSHKFKICIFAGSLGTKAVETLWKELSDQRLVYSSALKVIPATPEGLEELKTIVQEGRIDVLIRIPLLDNPELNDKVTAACPDTDALSLMLSGDRYVIRLLPSTTSDATYLDGVDAVSETLMKFAEILKRDFGKPLPRLAVFSTQKGSQAKLSEIDQEVLIPAIRKVFEAKVPVFGPYLYEPFLEAHNEERFDGLVLVNQNISPYTHSSYGSCAIDYRMQLPFIWLNPLDVTVEQLPSALMQTVFVARDILYSRLDYAEISKNPLKFELKRENNEHQAF